MSRAGEEGLLKNGLGELEAPADTLRFRVSAGVSISQKNQIDFSLSRISEFLLLNFVS